MMKITIEPVQRNQMDAVINLLNEGISSFRPDREKLDKIWKIFEAQKNVHSVVATFGSDVVGYGSIVLETKIRGGIMGHIEDIVAHTNFSRVGVGKTIIEALIDIARLQGCYKVALQCKDHNVEFYEKCGFAISGVAMQRF